MQKVMSIDFSAGRTRSAASSKEALNLQSAGNESGGISSTKRLAPDALMRVRRFPAQSCGHLRARISIWADAPCAAKDKEWRAL
jgi:hypothetical protein